MMQVVGSEFEEDDMDAQSLNVLLWRNVATIVAFFCSGAPTSVRSYRGHVRNAGTSHHSIDRAATLYSDDAKIVRTKSCLFASRLT
jgi:hypothetical protein